jgi:hypothetical protein
MHVGQRRNWPLMFAVCSHPGYCCKSHKKRSGLFSADRLPGLGYGFIMAPLPITFGVKYGS